MLIQRVFTAVFFARFGNQKSGIFIICANSNLSPEKMENFISKCYSNDPKYLIKHPYKTYI